MLVCFSSCFEFLLQGLVLFFQSLDCGEDVLDLYKILKSGSYFFDLLHQICLHLHTHLHYSADEIALLLPLQQQTQHYFDYLFDQFPLGHFLFISSCQLFSLHLDEVLLNGSEVGMNIEGNVIEPGEVGEVDLLQKLVDKTGAFEVLEIIEGDGLTLQRSLSIDPGQHEGRSVIIGVHLVYFKYKNYSKSIPFLPPLFPSKPLG